MVVIRELAAAARFTEMRHAARDASQKASNIDLLLDIGGVLLAYGYLSDAQATFDRAQQLAPNDLRARLNLANVLRESGDHDQARDIYAFLQEKLPDNPVVRRNALIGLEYHPKASDAERVTKARQWGQWAIHAAGPDRPRPTMASLAGRALRIGYVSADLCQHTVGLFVKDVIKSHDPDRIEVFTYSAGQIRDWVTHEIQLSSCFRKVSDLSDQALAEQIESDRIDVLIDLSGHTAGSRLTAFAFRPAPIQVSWLGYFATTGLPSMDAVLLDEAHAPLGTEELFTERIVRLPSGRWCYVPVLWAPEVAPPPCLRNGFVTFGSFNNTAKYNHDVFRLWAEILEKVPDSRLILKWRTFNDELFCRQVNDAFKALHIRSDRIELRGPSFHANLLGEYADIDIALDPFPFSGGLTTCEALWMGVPVITMPQSRVVSRQTHAVLNQIGLGELSTSDRTDYLIMASKLAESPERLANLRRTMRSRMLGSGLTDVSGFTRSLESALLGLWQELLKHQ
jgi:predicted O-linked N-acetylglucosamine transferase (SPINDLY family)